MTNYVRQVQERRLGTKQASIYVVKYSSSGKGWPFYYAYNFQTKARWRFDNYW